MICLFIYVLSMYNLMNILEGTKDTVAYKIIDIDNAN